MAKRQSTPARGALLQHAPLDSVLGLGLRIMPLGRPEGTTYGPAAAPPFGLRTITILLAAVVATLAPPSLYSATLTSPPSAAPQIQMQPGAAQPAPSELPKVVTELAAQPELSAADCAKLARETVTFGESTRQSGQPLKPGIINDGLAAVDQGEATDAKAANWPELRAKLQELLKPPPPKQDEKKQDEKKEEQKKEEQKQQDQQQQQKKPQDQNQEQKQLEQQKKEQQQSQQQQSDKPEPPNDTQSVGGEKPKDDERKEHPELAVPLQKLDQVRDKDSPAELFQLLHNDEPPPSDQPKKDW